mgnify:CR=1 FL=1
MNFLILAFTLFLFDENPIFKNALNASVYISIESEKARSHGSGVIISSLPEKNGRDFDTYILTATHLFDEKIKEEIWVSVFDNQEIKYKAEICKKTKLADNEPDLTLIKIKTLRQMAFVKIADANYELKVGESVIQIGCPNGKRPPTIMEGNPIITAINRYLGYGNIECSGEPQEGRSGGGLFNSLYEIIGICNNREPKEKKGIYTSLAEIRKFLTGPEWQFLIGKNNPPLITTDIFFEKHKDIELTDLNDQKIQFSSLQGKVIFINFWATWCIPCVSELPSMQRLYDKLKNEEQIVFLFIGDEEQKTLQDFLKNHNLNIPVYRITNGALPLERPVIPMTYIIYKDGKNLYKHSGSAVWDTEEMINGLKNLMK